MKIILCFLPRIKKNVLPGACWCKLMLCNVCHAYTTGKWLLQFQYIKSAASAQYGRAYIMPTWLRWNLLWVQKSEDWSTSDSFSGRLEHWARNCGLSDGRVFSVTFRQFWSNGCGRPSSVFSARRNCGWVLVHFRVIRLHYLCPKWQRKIVREWVSETERDRERNIERETDRQSESESESERVREADR